MSKVRIQSFAISIDGYGAGPNQDLQNPLGVNGLSGVVRGENDSIDLPRTGVDLATSYHAALMKEYAE